MASRGRYIARRRRLVTGALIALALIIASTSRGAASAATAQQTIALLNAQRAANGIPAGITEDPTWSGFCADHDSYMALNHLLTHDEQPGSPGYTADGAWAGVNSVLLQNAGWDSGNPYEDAPLHLDQLLAPRLQVLGSADQDGFSCTTTFPGWTRPDPPGPVVYTYPGNGAQIYASELARERPWTPGQLANILSGTRTGPYLIVFADTPGAGPTNNPATLSGASLTGPNGPAAVATVDGTTPVPGASGATLSTYIAPGGFIIPLKPLIAGVTYHAAVTVTFAGSQIPYGWSFTTVGASPHSLLTARGQQLSFSSYSAQPVSVTFTRAGGQHAQKVKLFPGHSVRLRLAPGSWQACGHQPGTNRFAPFVGCVTIVVTGTPALTLGRPRVVGDRLVFPLAFDAVLRGRPATLTVAPLNHVCLQHGCTVSSGRPTTRTIRLRNKTLSLPLPPRGHGLTVSLQTLAFLLGDAPWAAARTSRRFIAR